MDVPIYTYRLLLPLFFLLFGVRYCQSQQLDSIILANDTIQTNDTIVAAAIDTLSKVDTDTLKFKPKRAALLSTILPGLGQAYNKQIYKTPIYPAGIVLSFSTALKYSSDFDKLGKSIEEWSGSATLEADSMRNLFRIKQTRARQISNAATFMTGFFYLANVIDAFASAKIKNTRASANHSPVLAGYRSAALPGMGQIYNKQYWKVPVVWGALVTSGAFAIYFNERKNCYTNTYLNRVRYNYIDEDFLDNCFSNAEAAKIAPESELLRYREFNKKNLETTLLIMGGIYVLNIADALVYGHLRNFDIDDNLDLSILPVFKYQPNGTTFTGIGLKLRL